MRNEETSNKKTTYAWTGDKKGHEFLFSNNLFKNLANKISYEIIKYLKVLEINTDLLDIYYQRSWATFTENDQQINFHTHSQSNISFAYYLMKPESSGGIIFKSNDTLYNEDLGEIKGNFTNIDFQGRDQVDLLIQPEDLEHDDKSQLKFDVVDKKFRGSSFIYILKTHSNLMLPVFVHSHHEHLHQENEKFGIKQPIYIDHLVCF